MLAHTHTHTPVHDFRNAMPRVTALHVALHASLTCDIVGTRSKVVTLGSRSVS